VDVVHPGGVGAGGELQQSEDDKGQAAVHSGVAVGRQAGNHSEASQVSEMIDNVNYVNLENASVGI
jgi:hypothetical protein